MPQVNPGLLYLRHSLDARRPRGADGEPVAGVFNVAPRDYFAALGLDGCANPATWKLNFRSLSRSFAYLLMKVGI